VPEWISLTTRRSVVFPSQFKMGRSASTTFLLPVTLESFNK
jgi:hypothetical protein